MDMSNEVGQSQRIANSITVSFHLIQLCHQIYVELLGGKEKEEDQIPSDTTCPT